MFPFVILEEAADAKALKGGEIALIILSALVIVAWIFVLVKFLVIRKLRIRYFVNETLVNTMYYKKGSPIISYLPTLTDDEVFEGWYLDEMFIEPLEYEVMPDKNLKLYAKITKKEEN